MPTLFDVKIGESQSAIEEEMGEDTRVQVRGAGGRFFVQENTVSDDGRQLNKQTIGRGSRDVERQIQRARAQRRQAVTEGREIDAADQASDTTNPRGNDRKTRTRNKKLARREIAIDEVRR